MADRNPVNPERFTEASRLFRQVVDLFQSPDQDRENGTRFSGSASATRRPPVSEINRLPSVSPSATLSSPTGDINSHIARQTGQTTLASEGRNNFATNNNRSASQEFRDAFVPYSRHAYQANRFSRRGGASSFYRAPSSRGGSKKYSNFNNTWTHKFCVIPFKEHEHVPSLQEKDSWRSAGLGEKSVVFTDKNGGQEHIEDTLFSAFPKLRDAGGFLLMRSGTRQNSSNGVLLQLITIPFGGYTIPYLKYDSPLRSATCFVRPMQRDLPLDPQSSSTDAANYASMPTVQCLQCHEFIAINIMQDHLENEHSKKSRNETLMDYFPTIEKDEENSTDEEKQEETKNVSSGATEEYHVDISSTRMGIPTEETQDKQGDLSQLQAIFPSRPLNEIEDALSNSMSVELAVDELLSNSQMPSASDESSRVDGDMDSISISDYFETKRVCDYSRPFRVKFAGIEQGIDAGGPRREFFQLLANKLASTEVGLFEGISNSLLPVMSSSSLRLGHFKIVGKVIAHSIANGGIGFQLLAEPVYTYLTVGSAEDCLPSCSIDLVPDTDARELIEEIAQTEGKSDLDKIAEKPDVIDYAQKCGWTSLITLEKKEHLIATMLLHKIIWKRQAAINQIAEGLKMLDVLQLLKNHPNCFREKFVYSKVEVTKERLLKEIIFSMTSTSEECRTKEYFLSYLELPGCIRLGEGRECTRPEAVLSFSTGQQILTETGLSEKITVEYTIVESDDFPSASTCGNVLILPTKHKSSEDFFAKMDKAFEIEAVGFGEA
eukprot:Seg1779.3 transcript_id=Seg1779.3/GoldUCD/mRNA.D3Y31 product="G2/M phase-specific E3 ubiquitin-protein ligase" protein_id=Seg1779.3/GoldUCD/D3Y31